MVVLDDGWFGKRNNDECSLGDWIVNKDKLPNGLQGVADICKKNGLTGEQGVIIPKNNSRNVILSDEVENAIKEGKFHIYTVENVEEAMEILTDMKINEVKELVKSRLDSFNKVRKSLD